MREILRSALTRVREHAADHHRRRTWRRDSIALATAGFAAAALAVFPTCASANFAWLGAGAGEFPHSKSEAILNSSPGGLAVNESSGDLYQADEANHRVLRFDAEGKFLEAWGWGTGDGKRQYERCGPAAKVETGFAECPGRSGIEGKTPGEAIPGEGEGQFGEDSAVVVDQATGDVFVLSGRTNGFVEEFTAAGKYITSFGKIGSTKPEEVSYTGLDTLSVDKAGNVYIGDSNGVSSRILEFEQISPGMFSYSREVINTKIEFLQIALQDAHGDFILSDGTSVIEKFAASNLKSPEWTLSTTSKANSEPNGLTVNPVTGEAYFYDEHHNRFYSVSPAGVLETGFFSGATEEKQAVTGAVDPNAVIGGHSVVALYEDEPYEGIKQRPTRDLIFTEKASSPPVVGEEAVSEIGAKGAKLSASVNPEGFSTRYRFEYGSEGPCGVNKCAEAPVGGASAGVEATAESESVNLSGLSPETLYHYRVVAENEFGVVDGGDETFTTLAAPSTGGGGGSTGVADGRVYELVSPAEKHGGEVFPLDAHLGSCYGGECEPGRNSSPFPEEAAPDGESVVYEGYPFALAPEGGYGAVDENEYLARRTTNGWVTTNLSPEAMSLADGRGFWAFSADFSTGVIAQREPSLAPQAPEGVEDLYLAPTRGALTPLLSFPPVEPIRMTLKYGASTADLSHVVFVANGAITPETAFAPQAPPPTEIVREEGDLYEWSAGAVRLVNVLPGNAKAVPGAVLGSGRELSYTSEDAGDYCHAVSSDGSRVFWSTRATGQVYVRVNGEFTTEIPDAGKFLCASADGSMVVLSDGGVYTVSGEPGREPTRVVDLGQGMPGFQGVAGASEALDRIYFVDTAALAAEAGPERKTPKAGADNLYLWESPGRTRFIGALEEEDNDHNEGLVGVWHASPSDRIAQASPEGRYLAFESSARLTAFDNETTCKEGYLPSGLVQRCLEVYEFDAVKGELVCASCNASGQRPQWASVLSLRVPVATHFPQPRNLLANGRLYFDSYETLTADDVRPGVENVYEYERDGQGSCVHQGGCVYLISTGHSSEDASFFSADETGSNVFFATRQELLPEDRDGLVDLYDAREGGGFDRVTPPAPCSGEGCRPPSAPAPSSPTVAATVMFSGPGNQSPPVAGTVKPTASIRKAPKCPKGKVRKRGKHGSPGKCVKRGHARRTGR